MHFVASATFAKSSGKELASELGEPEVQLRAPLEATNRLRLLPVDRHSVEGQFDAEQPAWVTFNLFDHFNPDDPTQVCAIKL